MVVAGIVLFRALLTVCLSIVSIVRISSWCKSAMVIVVVILSIFVSNSTPFPLILFLLGALRKSESRLGYILEFETAKNRTFLAIMSIKNYDLEENSYRSESIYVLRVRCDRLILSM